MLSSSCFKPHLYTSGTRSVFLYLDKNSMRSDTNPVLLLDGWIHIRVSNPPPPRVHDSAPDHNCKSILEGISFDKLKVLMSCT